MVADAPPPLNWDEYAAWLEREWRLTLSASMDESVIHSFLETHPCLLPGGEGSGESLGGHHGSWLDTVISKPLLRGMVDREPDFMWMTHNSEEIIPVLIEIESPAKRWFTDTGRPSAQFTQAQNQLAEWKQLLDSEAGRLLFDRMYELPDAWRESHRLVVRLLLVYGRRAETERQRSANQRRGVLRGDHVDAMTFDRLKPMPGLRNAVTIKFRGRIRTVISVPPTFRLGPRNADLIASAGGWADAIERNQLMSTDRKEFLKRRIPYWSELGRQDRGGVGLGITVATDWE